VVFVSDCCIIRNILFIDFKIVDFMS
jgi:hypothetical protein